MPYKERMIKPQNKTRLIAFSGFYQHCIVTPGFDAYILCYKNSGSSGKLTVPRMDEHLIRF
jgi:hypothetical protein